MGQVVAGGPLAGNTPFHRAFQGWAQGQCAGRCSILRRCGAAIRAGTLTIWRRRVAPRATAQSGAGEGAGGAQQVVGDRRADRPRAVRGEPPGGQVGQRAVDQVGEHGLDDRVPTMGDVRARGRLVAVGQERVVPPDRERSASLVWSRTRRTTSRAVTGCLVDANAVNCVRRPAHRRSAPRCPGRAPLPGSAPAARRPRGSWRSLGSRPGS